MAEQIFVLLYPLVTAISVIAYLPQIKVLLFSKAVHSDISLSAWILWSLTGFVSFGYALLHVGDFMLCLATGVNMALVFVTAALIIYNRYIRRRHATPPL